MHVGPAPYSVLGSDRIRALANAFYDQMSATEPALARLHPPGDGTIPEAARERFALFLIGWLGGPNTYEQTYGHPRLRMRHGHVPVTVEHRDAWLRAMQRALDSTEVTGPVRAYLDERFVEVAEFLRNR